MDNKYDKNKRNYLMPGIEPKKMAILRINEILLEHTDAEHPMTQNEIAHKLETDYGIVLERKAIGRHIADLIDAGIDICQGKNGCYVQGRDFEDAELRLLIDGVLQSKYISAKHSKDLIDKLCRLSNKFFRPHVKHVYSVNDWSKTENKYVFYNISIIDEAISEGKQVKYDYNKFGVDGKLHKTKTHQISPYQLILHNQRYYLMGCSDFWKNMAHHRLDRITNIEIVDQPAVPIRNLPGYNGGIDYKKISSTMPYFYTDPAERVEFVASGKIVDQIVDWFGDGVSMTDIGDGKIKAEVKVSLKAMEFWALQYVKYVEVTFPAQLRDNIKSALQNGLDAYK